MRACQRIRAKRMRWCRLFFAISYSDQLPFWMPRDVADIVYYLLDFLGDGCPQPALSQWRHFVLALLTFEMPVLIRAGVFKTTVQWGFLWLNLRQFSPSHFNWKERELSRIKQEKTSLYCCFENSRSGLGRNFKCEHASNNVVVTI